MNPEPIFGIPNIKEVFKIVDLQYIDVPEEIGFWKASYRKWMGRRKARRAELIIANSLYTKAKIVECFGINAERVHVIYEALDNDFFNMNWLDPQVIKGFKSRFSIDYPFIIYVSSFRPYKNHSLLLNAFSKLRERGLPYHLVLIGNDIKGYRRQIENKAIEMQLTRYIHFFDYVHHWDLRLFYAAADLAVYPSELETFGIPPLEAMACGVPVIVSDRTAVPEISGGGSLVVNPHDIPLMAESMFQVLSNKKLKKELKDKGKSWCKQFTWERNISETIQLMKTLAS
ncbi:MAG: glycosyltransferase family 1 protein [Candidatus Aminicenantales bacterium]|jgi:glycosyltransferase involved in cell wall biosynthesis